MVCLKRLDIGGNTVLFNLETVKYRYNEEDKKKLEALGFEFVLDNFKGRSVEANIYRKTDKQVTIIIRTFQKLRAFIKEWGEIIIDEETIKIYDDFI